MLTMPNPPTIPIRVNTVARELAQATIPIRNAVWPKPILSDEGRKALNRAAFEVAIEAWADSREHLTQEEQMQILSLLLSNFIASQVLVEISSSISSVLSPDRLIQTR